MLYRYVPGGKSLAPSTPNGSVPPPPPLGEELEGTPPGPAGGFSQSFRYRIQLAVVLVVVCFVDSIDFAFSLHKPSPVKNFRQLI